ncbi:MAG: polymerase [Verrucomicrobiales bacterium]|nr:polymerase [Verrucomicrobiales bacterium]
MKLHRVILHLDMDAFYASVEQRDAPELRGKPVIVGAPPSQRGVVCAASYEARKFGVRSAMPSSTAARLCPRGIFIRPRMSAYQAESNEIMRWVREIAGDQVQQVSVDEAYVDVSGQFQKATADESIESAMPLARKLKQIINRERRLTATVGIAGNKLLSKLASDFRKPDGLTHILESQKVEFLAPLPVRSLHGVGQVTAQNLEGAGLRTVGDIQNYKGDLRALVGAWGPELKLFARGEDHRPLDMGDEVKSISSENTFLKDTSDRPTLRRCLIEQAHDISEKLIKYSLAAYTVQVKIRYADFVTLTRQMSFEEPVVEWKQIYRVACVLLARDGLVSRPLRLLGIGVTGLVDSAVQQLKLPFAI